jgi:hypothetical protein
MSFVRELYELCERRGAFLDIRGARLAHGAEWADVSVDEYGVTGKVGRPVTERTRIVDIYRPGDAYVDASPDLEPEEDNDLDGYYAQADYRVDVRTATEPDDGSWAVAEAWAFDDIDESGDA